VSFLDRLRQKRPPPAELDELMLRQLRARGADLTRPRHVLHFLYFADETAARRAALAAEAAGYDVSVGEPDGSVAEWSVRAEATRVVNQTTVNAFRAWFERRAAQHGGEYDGWEAAAEP
jgi:hypothetical protein